MRIPDELKFAALLAVTVAGTNICERYCAQGSHLVSYQAVKVPPRDVKQCQSEYCLRGEEKS